MAEFKLHKLVRKNVRDLTPYSSARDEFDAGNGGYIFLDANESPYGTGLNRYPDPRQKILKALLAKERGIGEDSILIGNGSDEVLDLLFRTFCDPGRDAVITLPPTYGMYNVLARTNGVENREVLLQSDFQPDVGAIMDKVDEKVKMILLCSPNNPTANLFHPEILEELLQRFNGLVVIDEAYIDFAQKPSWVTRLAEFPNLVVTQTLSKAYGLAAIRVGTCYASPELIAYLNRIKPPYNVNHLSQEQAFRRLLNTQVVKKQVKTILSQREILRANFSEIPWIEEVFPSDANFLLVRVDDAGRRYRELLEAGFVVRDRSNQPLCENTLRFTVGTPAENKKLIAQLKTMR